MNRLYLFYDGNCELCRRLQEWLGMQRAWVPLVSVPANSPEARMLFPELGKVVGRSDLAVVSDSGDVYLNNHAWIMCLYALEEYRDWALRLASPMLQPLARQAWEMLSRNRAMVSRWMSSSEQAMAEELRSIPVRECGPKNCQVTDTNAEHGEGSRSHTSGDVGIQNTVRDYLQ